MGDRRWSLTLLPGTLAVARLGAGEPLPAWVGLPSAASRDSPICSVTRTAGELSMVCAASRVPASVTAECDWRALEVAGPLDFSEVGVLASLTASLAAAGVSIFALSTFDTDYLLVREAALTDAVEALRRAGHEVTPGVV